MHLLHGKNRGKIDVSFRANVVCRSRGSKSSHADMLRQVGQLGRWKRPHDYVNRWWIHQKESSSKKHIQPDQWLIYATNWYCDIDLWCFHVSQIVCSDGSQAGRFLWNIVKSVWAAKNSFFPLMLYPICSMVLVYLPTKLGDLNFRANVGKYMQIFHTLSISHRIHVWYICWHWGYMDGKCYHI